MTPGGRPVAGRRPRLVARRVRRDGPRASSRPGCPRHSRWCARVGRGPGLAPPQATGCHPGCVIIDQAVYRHGERQACSDLSDELAAVREDGHGWIWIGLKDPTDAEFDLVKDELQLHPLAVEDAIDGHQRPKLEIYDASLFVVVKPLRYIDATSDIETGEVMVFLGDRFVVTVRRGEAGPLAAVRKLIESDPTRLSIGPVSVLHGVMDAVVDNYDLIDREIQEDMERLETSRLRRRPQQRRPRDLRPQARGAGDAARRDPAHRAGPPVVRGRHPARAGGGQAVLPRRGRPPAAQRRPHRVLRPAADRHPERAPGPGRGPAERRHAQDLGLGGHRGHPDSDRRASTG